MHLIILVVLTVLLLGCDETPMEKYVITELTTCKQTLGYYFMDKPDRRYEELHLSKEAQSHIYHLCMADTQDYKVQITGWRKKQMASE